MDLHVFPIPIPPPTSLSSRSLWVFPVHQVRALVSCIQPGLVICFTLDNIHFRCCSLETSQPHLLPQSPKSVLYICLFFCFAYRVIIKTFFKCRSLLSHSYSLNSYFSEEPLFLFLITFSCFSCFAGSFFFCLCSSKKNYITLKIISILNIFC